MDKPPPLCPIRAKASLDTYTAEALGMVEKIAAHLKTLREQPRPDWGDVGDARHVHWTLSEILEGLESGAKVRAASR